MNNLAAVYAAIPSEGITKFALARLAGTTETSREAVLLQMEREGLRLMEDDYGKLYRYRMGRCNVCETETGIVAVPGGEMCLVCGCVPERAQP